MSQLYEQITLGKEDNPGPLIRDRFGATYRLEYYTTDELEKIISRSSKILDAVLHQEAAMELARRSRFTPRISNRLLKRVRDFAQVHGHDTIILETEKKYK